MSVLLPTMMASDLRGCIFNFFVAAGFGPQSNNHVRHWSLFIVPIDSIVTDAGFEVEFLHGFLSNKCAVVHFNAACFGNDHEFRENV